MIWLLLALLVFAAVFLQRVVVPMVFGALIGGAVMLVAPMLKFEAAPELIVFCGAAGLALGVGRIVLFGTGGKSSE